MLDDVLALFAFTWANAIAVVVSAVISILILVLGVFVFRRLERPVLKEL